MDYLLLIIGVLLIVVTILLIGLAKNLILNSIIGAMGFLICYFVFNIKLPIVVTLIASAIFGPAGLGVMLLLWLFKII
ncbi:MAG TPA: hypothetical protein PK655_01075 [archaeon]|jgi:hypothetical protein|nr:hypothetical protein [archaeon]HRS42335.1 hypothetical protein [Candidatus Diapherotrites archaeon]